MDPNQPTAPAPELATMFAKLQVAATAPDRSVTVRYSHRGGFGVEFDDRVVDQHGDESLARMVTAALTATLTGYRDALDRVAGAAAGILPGDPRTRALLRRQRYRLGAEACREVTTTATSAGRRVRVRMTGLNRVECRIRPGTLADREVGLDRLGAEIVSAYNQAKFQHRQAVRETAGRDVARYI